MAVFLNNSVGVKLDPGTGAVDLSNHVNSITINRNFDELEVTAMGDSGHKFIKGLEASSITIDFLNDTANASVLQTLQAAWGKNCVLTMVQTKGTTTTINAQNPLYTATVLVNQTTDINGATGDLSTQSVTWNVSGTIAVSTSGTF
jgi:hypothetical protein